MKKLLAFFSFAFLMTVANNSFAQFSVGNDTTICAAPFTLHAGGNIGTVTGPTPTFLDCTDFNSCDDGYSIGVINLGFTFTYYGIPYTQCVLGTNGIINFDISLAGTYCQWPVSAAIPTASDPTNSIMWPWQDLYYPAAAGGTAFMSYATFGTAPNRYIVFDFNSVPMYSCNALIDCQQVILYETTNIIEIPIASKPLCTTWNGGNAIEGVQNATGTMADWVPGRNWPTQWTASNDCYRFTPAGGNYTVAPFVYSPTPMFVGAAIDWYENGILVGTGDSLVVNPPVGTTQYIAVTSNCGSSISDTMLLTLDPMTLSMAFINPTCANAANGSVTATAAGTGPYTYVWTDSLGNIIQTDANINGASTLANQFMGTYHVAVTGALGCVLIDSSTLTAAFFASEFTWTPTGYCQYKDLQFNDASLGVAPTGWLWDFGDGSTQSLLQSPTHMYADSGLFTASLIVMVPGGCTDTMTHVIQAWPAPIAAFGATPTTVCVGRQVNFFDQSNYYPKSWSWNFGDDSTGNGNSVFHSYGAAGIYTVTLIETDSLCGNDTAVGILNVNWYPVTSIGEDTSICKGTLLQLDAGIPGVEYLWSTGETTQKITISPQKPTEYNVTLDNHGCTYNDAIEIGILCELYIPNAFSPNRDGTNDIFIPYGTEVTHIDIRIYNRWGEMVFNSAGNSITKGWNGYVGSDEASVGVYSYVISATFINNETKMYKGNITLLR